MSFGQTGFAIRNEYYTVNNKKIQIKRLLNDISHFLHTNS